MLNFPEFVIRRPDGRYVGFSKDGELLPEDGNRYGSEILAEYDLRKLGVGHSIWELKEAPLPPMTLVSNGKYFAQNKRGGLSRRGQNVSWVSLDQADRYTENDLILILSQHPDAYQVTDNEALQIEGDRSIHEGSEYQYEQSYGF